MISVPRVCAPVSLVGDSTGISVLLSACCANGTQLLDRTLSVGLVAVLRTLSLGPVGLDPLLARDAGAGGRPLEPEVPVLGRQIVDVDVVEAVRPQRVLGG